MDPKAKKTADVFRGGRQIWSVDLTGEPMAADGLGMIYIAEQEEGPFGSLQGEGGFPKVVRYAVVRNGDVEPVAGLR
jgi:hypothetical protein